MEIELRFFADFRETVGRKSVSREYDDDTQVGEVLRDVTAEYPGLDLFGEDGELQDYLRVLRNGRDIAHIDSLETALEDGDRVSVFPPVAGG